MKSKGVTVGLLIAVVGIWGFLFLKIFNDFNGTKAIPHKSLSERPKDNQDKVDTYKIHAYSRDPFLSILEDTVTIVAPIVEHHPKPAPIKNVVLPQYFGMIKSDKTLTAIVKFEKKTFFVNEGSNIRSFKVAKITPDSIICIENGKPHFVRLFNRLKHQ